jgi:hypothetical protein
MLSFRLELRPPESWVSFFPLYHRSYEIWGLLPRSPPIAALLIIPAIFWGQNYVLVLVYWCVLMMYSFCNDVQFLYTYPSFWGVFRRGQAFFIFVFSLLYYILPLLTVFFSSHNLTVCCRETPRKFQFAKKSAKVYHCLYSSTEQLQMALWTFMFF